jgi:hypothetical protein
VQTGVDDLKSRVTKRASNHFGATIVSVKPGFGDDDAVRAIHKSES